jgi:hypothetical protein
MESGIGAHERYKVDIPVDAEITDKLRDFRPLHNPDKGVHRLLPVDRLSRIFPTDPIDGHLHIIVQPPPPGEFSQLQSPQGSRIYNSLLLAFLYLNCLVRGEGRDDILMIKIARSESVSTLQQNIKAAKYPNSDIHPPKLWKVLCLDQVGDIYADGRCQVDFPINDEVINMLRNSGPLDPDKGFYQLSPIDKLSRVFPTDPIDEHLHIIVQSPGEFLCLLVLRSILT